MGIFSGNINHEVSSSVLETFKGEVIKLFQLPMEEKKKLWQQADKNSGGFGQLFVVSDEQKLDWCDIFSTKTLPSRLRPEVFNKLPQSVRIALEAYSISIHNLAQTLLNNMAKALGIDEMEMKELFNDGIQAVRMNYYPPCPEPNKVLGIAPHSDACALTVLLQLNDTPGLQVRKDGNWIPVIPLQNAFVVNVGDAMEIISNGKYRSIEHRGTVNSTKERLTVATFQTPNRDAELGPSKSIIGPLCPPNFRTEIVANYYKRFFAKELDGKSNLEVMRL